MRYVLAILALFLVGQAQAQTSGCPTTPSCVTQQIFTPVATFTMAVTAVSSSVTLPTVGPGYTMLVLNGNGAQAFVAVGGVGVVATTASTPIGTGQPLAIPQALNTVIAAVTATGTTTLTVIVGQGTPLIVYQQTPAGPTTVSISNLPTTQPVSGTVTAAQPIITWGAPVTGTAAQSSVTIVSSPGVNDTLICNTTAIGGGTLWLNLSGGTAVANAGLPIVPTDCKTTGPLAATSLNGISSAGTISFSVEAGN